MTTPRRRRHARGWGRESPRKQLFAEVSFPFALLQSATPKHVGGGVSRLRSAPAPSAVVEQGTGEGG